MNIEKKKFKTIDESEYRLTEEIGRLISRLYRAQYEEIGLALKELDITALHSTILTNIFRYPELNQNQLAEVLCIDKATISRILRVLEYRNLIKRISDETDRRLSIITLTPEGTKLVKNSLQKQKKVWDIILENLSIKQQEDLAETLQIMFNNINKSQYN